MDKSNNIFSKIDDFIFQKLDFLKNEGSFQKVNELLSGLDEAQQKIFEQIITFTFILIPYLIIIFLWWGNHKIRTNMEVKSQILDQISTLSGNKDARSFLSSTYLAPVAIASSDELDNKIKHLLASNNIDQTKVKVLNYTQVPTTSSITKIEASISFQNFGTLDFSNFMRLLVDQEKFKVMRINLEKNKTSNLLDGTISLIHLGKNSEN